MLPPDPDKCRLVQGYALRRPNFSVLWCRYTLIPVLLMHGGRGVIGLVGNRREPSGGAAARFIEEQWRIRGVHIL